MTSRQRQSAYLQVTRKCNSACVFCSNPQFNKEFTLDEAKQQINEFKEKGVTEIFFTGGEPTIVPFLPDAIRYCKHQGINPKIITNGVMLSNKELCKKLYDSGLTAINVSVHSVKPSVSDKIAKRKGFFKKTLQGIYNAISVGIEVSINSTLNSLNQDHLATNALFWIKHFPSIKHFSYNNLDPGMADGYIPTRAGQNAWIVAKLSDLELELYTMVKVLKKYNKTFRIERVPLCYMQGFEEYSTETRKIVKDEMYMCAFIEDGRDNELRIVKPGDLRVHAKACESCTLKPICAGVQQEYISIHGESELYPVFKDPQLIIQKINNEH